MTDHPIEADALALHTLGQPAAEHGGNLDWAREHFGTPAEGWLDLSTGISPWSYPAAPESTDAWHGLPSPAALEHRAAQNFGAPALAVPGSQLALNLLPALRARSRVAIPKPEYAEHARAWQRWGHDVTRVSPQALADSPPEALDWDVVVLSHPNNPTGGSTTTAHLLSWRKRLAERGGWLVVDEAFTDAHPERSLATSVTDGPGLIVLRSLGKFFGLAGARIGFVLAHGREREALRELLGPWPVAGPSLARAESALQDTAWCARHRDRLAAAGRRLAHRLDAAGLTSPSGTHLFRWVPSQQSRAWQHALAEQGIWVRAFDDPPGLRFGLPGTPDEEERLGRALARARKRISD